MASVLLVESDAWTNVLHAAGHAVLTATMRDAATVLREGGIDVVVIDSDAPLSVLELAHVIEQLPDAPPVVLISGSVAAPEVSARIGAAAFLPKPCETSDILGAITRIAGRLHPVRLFEDEPTGRTPVIG